MSVETIGLKKASQPTRRHFAERMVERGATDADFVVFESDIGHSTFSYLFGEKYPDRYFNMGIAEMATVSAAAGFAAEGRHGVRVRLRGVPHHARRGGRCARSSATRTLNVKFLSSHGGLTAAIDGVTHQATEDIAFMTTLPGMQVLAPCDRVSARAAFDTALETPGPVFTRLMRDAAVGPLPRGGALPPRRVEAGARGRRPHHRGLRRHGDPALCAPPKTGGEGASRPRCSTCTRSSPWTRAAVLASVATGPARCWWWRTTSAATAWATSWPCSCCSAAGGGRAAFENLGLDDRFGESGDYERVIDKYGISARRIAAAAGELVGRKQQG